VPFKGKRSDLVSTPVETVSTLKAQPVKPSRRSPALGTVHDLGAEVLAIPDPEIEKTAGFTP